MSEHASVARLEAVRAAIHDATAKAGRPADAVTLVAVSKVFGADAIWPAIAAGQRVFGENRVQEAAGKWPELRQKLLDAQGAAIDLHLIGPLQSNKAREAVALFDRIETVDRDKIAGALADEMAKQNRPLPCLVQVNTGREPQKAGIEPREAAAFVARCREVHGLTIDGFMCIPPIDDAPREHFSLLVRLADETGLPVRSMGMSGDYPIAIAKGATHVRVGSAIFGERPKR
ncbi:MAG: YggS family pyridoxal phosphate-dependent enzyme [Devosiaceae bacterium]|nr:YggS family pyridoxal phosphate-dependent enzyme [Devosiaceae bacterium MH13]